MDVKKVVEKDSVANKEFAVVVPRELLQQKTEEELVKIQQKYALDGFRMGKVPLDLIRPREFERCFYRVCEKFVQDYVTNLIEENKYNLLLKPQINLKIMAVTQDLEFSVMFDLLTPLNLDFVAMEVEKYNIILDDTSVDTAIELSIKDNGKFVPVTRPVQDGDLVTLDFSGTINGKEFPGSEAREFKMRLEKGDFFTNAFRNQLPGLFAGEEREIWVTYPENYHRSDLANKEALFQTRLITVEEKQELNDEFVKRYCGFESLQLLREKIRKDIEKAYQELSQRVMRLQLEKYLTENIFIELPENLKLLYQDVVRLEQNRSLIELSIEELEKEAEKRAKLYVILCHLQEIANYTFPTQDELKNRISQEMEAALQDANRDQVIQKYQNDFNYASRINREAMRARTWDYALERIKKQEKNISLDDFKKLPDYSKI